MTLLTGIDAGHLDASMKPFLILNIVPNILVVMTVHAELVLPCLVRLVMTLTALLTQFPMRLRQVTGTEQALQGFSVGMHGSQEQQAQKGSRYDTAQRHGYTFLLLLSGMVQRS